jgi:integrase/recombinase XerC
VSTADSGRADISTSNISTASICNTTSSAATIRRAHTGTAHGQAAEIEVARLLLQRLGVRPEDLLAAGDALPGPRAPARMPTISEYLPRVASAVPTGTHQVYGSYWRRIETAWGGRRIDEPTAVELEQLAQQTRATAVTRRNSRGGQTAAAHLIAAARCLYQHAEHDGLITAADNPARKARKPRKLASTRRAIPDARIAEINQVAATTGNDPELDCLILRLHEETACRRGGALALRPADLERHDCFIFLREKGDTLREQPVSPTLMRHLADHASERGAEHDGPLLRYRNGRPITARRYDYLWDRLGQHLPWVARQGVTAHWLRHTTLTWVERNFSYAVARAYAGHEGGLNGAGVTATYVRADIEEVAAALAALTGEPHPLAPAHTSDTPQPAIGAPPVWWQPSAELAP